MYTQLIILVVFGIIAQYLYKNYKLSEESFESHEHYKLVNQYFIGEKASRRKPILWIHTSTEVNARNWESFYSRNSTKLNQPYLQITMKSIYDKCKDSFNICLINDESFHPLLSWNVELDDLAEPIKSHYRRLGLSMLLHEYGGIIIPQSFLCTKDVKGLYDSGLSKNNMFVLENNNTGITNDQESFLPDMMMMGCRRKNECMKQFIAYQEELYLDKTNQSDFIGNTRLWLKLQKELTIVDGTWIGLKKIDNSAVTIQELLGTSHIDIPITYGVYMPQEEILKRPKFSWFARMSTKQILESELLFAKFVLASY